MKAIDRVRLLQENVFENEDIFKIIKDNIDCDTITNFCLTNSTWCKKILANHELREDVAKCIIDRINKCLNDIFTLLSQYMREQWRNEPNDVLFIELAPTFLAVAVQLPPDSPDTAAIFEQAHPQFKELTRKLAVMIATLFHVRLQREYTGRDRYDDRYLSFQIKFNQSIPRNVIMRLPFSKEVTDHDNQISMWPIQNLNATLNTIRFDRLLEWPHVRRSLRHARSLWM